VGDSQHGRYRRIVAIIDEKFADATADELQAALSRLALSRLALSHVALSHLALSHVALSHLALSRLALSRLALSHVALSHVALSHLALSHMALSRLALSHVALSHSALSHLALSHFALLVQSGDNTCIVCREDMTDAKKVGRARHRTPEYPKCPSYLAAIRSLFSGLRVIWILRLRSMFGVQLPCGHIFHLRCLRQWTERQMSCPTCRADLDPPPPLSPHEGARIPAHHMVVRMSSSGVALPIADGLTA
jgi:hypothetical protein